MTRKRKFKEVTKEEFETFIKNYPRKLESNFFMDWVEYYDFPSENYKPKDLDDLDTYKVARHGGMYGDLYYVMSEGGKRENMNSGKRTDFLNALEDFVKTQGFEVMGYEDNTDDGGFLNIVFNEVGYKENVMYQPPLTNQQMLATISAEEFYDKIMWILHEYGKRYTDSRIAITEWLDSEVEDEQTKR